MVIKVKDEEEKIFVIDLKNRELFVMVCDLLVIMTCSSIVVTVILKILLEV